jgi:hypothetical protein
MGNGRLARLADYPARVKNELSELDSALVRGAMVAVGLCVAALIAWLTSAWPQLFGPTHPGAPLLGMMFAEDLNPTMENLDDEHQHRA